MDARQLNPDSTRMMTYAFVADPPSDKSGYGRSFQLKIAHASMRVGKCAFDMSLTGSMAQTAGVDMPLGCQDERCQDE